MTSRSEEKKIKTLFGFSDVRFFKKLFQIFSFGIIIKIFKNTSEIENFLSYRLKRR
jgi:hypothetical protein